MLMQTGTNLLYHESIQWWRHQRPPFDHKVKCALRICELEPSFDAQPNELRRWPSLSWLLRWDGMYTERATDSIEFREVLNLRKIYVLGLCSKFFCTLDIFRHENKASKPRSMLANLTSWWLCQTVAHNRKEKDRPCNSEQRPLLGSSCQTFSENHIELFRIDASSTSTHICLLCHWFIALIIETDFEPCLWLHQSGRLGETLSRLLVPLRPVNSEVTVASLVVSRCSLHRCLRLTNSKAQALQTSESSCPQQRETKTYQNFDQSLIFSMKTAQSQDEFWCFDLLRFICLQARLSVLWRPADRKSLLAKAQARVSIDTSIKRVFSFNLCYNHYSSVSAPPSSFILLLPMPTTGRLQNILW